MQKMIHELEHRTSAHIHTSDITAGSVTAIAGALNALLADVFALYLKTKNFHWHMSGPHFRDYHLLFDEQGDQLFGMTDDIAERVRKSVALRCDPSAILRTPNALPTTMRTTSRRRTCSANSGRTTKRW